MIEEQARVSAVDLSVAPMGPDEIEVLIKTTPWMAEPRRFDRMSKIIVRG